MAKDQIPPVSVTLTILTQSSKATARLNTKEDGLSLPEHLTRGCKPQALTDSVIEPFNVRSHPTLSDFFDFISYQAW